VSLNQAKTIISESKQQALTLFEEDQVKEMSGVQMLFARPAKEKTD
jgi:hypothetical protein